MNPTRLKYFVEHNGNWNRGSVDGREVMKMPIAYAFTGMPFGDVLTRNNLQGPGEFGGPVGALLVPAGELPKDYKIDDDDWFPVTATETPGIEARCWFGYPKSTPKPGPMEFLRADVRSGPNGIEHPLKLWRVDYSERFADGNVWEVPAARRFDFEKSESEFQAAGHAMAGLTDRLRPAISIDETGFVKFNMPAMMEIVGTMLPGVFSSNVGTTQAFRNGHWQDGPPARRYRELWDLALRVDRLFQQTQTPEESESLPGLFSDQAKNIAVKILQVFYNIGPDEAGWLEMFTEELFAYVLRRFCDYDTLEDWRQKKIAVAMLPILEEHEKSLSTPTGTEVSNSGSTVDSTITPPPSEN